MIKNFTVTSDAKDLETRNLKMNTKIVDHLVEDQVKDHNTQKGDLMKMMK